MIIKDTLIMELGWSEVDPNWLGGTSYEYWREFEFNVEIEFSEDYEAVFGGSYYTAGLLDCEVEGRDTQTGEILSFSPEIFTILEDNFREDKWLNDYLRKKEEDSLDL